MCDRCDDIALNGDSPEASAEWEVRWRRRTQAHIARDGFSIMAVDGGPVPFVYTIGLWLTRGHPELVVVGLDRDLSQPLLSVAGENIRDRRWRLAADDTVDTGWRVLRAVDLAAPEQVVVRANAFVELPPGESVPALQLLYPDAHGVWPWQPDCHLFPGQQTIPNDLAA